MKIMPFILIFQLGFNPGLGREWMYEMGRRGYEFVLKSATGLELHTSILESEVLWLCTNDFTCAIATLQELKKINTDNNKKLKELECLVYRHYFDKWSCDN